MTASSHQILSDYETSSASSTCLLYSKRTELVESPTETFCNRTDTAETFNVISNKIRDRSTSRPRPATPIAVCVTTEPLARWPHYDASSTPGTLHHANTMPQAIRTESFASSETVVSRNSASTDEQNHHDPNDRGGFKRMSYGRHSGDVSA